MEVACRVLFVLLVALQAVHGFHARSVPPPPCLVNHHPRTTTRLQQSSKAASSSSSEEAVLVLGRRELLAASCCAVVGSTFVAWQQQQQQQASSSSASNSDTLYLTSVEDALAVIDEQCDRRFLHAVVASDYRLLYSYYDQDTPTQPPPPPNTPRIFKGKTEPYPTDSKPKAKDFFQALAEQQLASVTTKNPHYQLVVTQPGDRHAMSLWPLAGSKKEDTTVHFAWPRDEQTVLWDQHTGSVMNPSQKLVVDGIDCGVMSLEDALERSNGQVLVYTSSYLLLPRTMEADLLSKLKESFII